MLKSPDINRNNNCKPPKKLDTDIKTISAGDVTALELDIAHVLLIV